MPAQQPTGVSIFAPTTIVTVTVESGADGGGEIHLHAGGQGFWVARMLARLGVPATLCSVFGGEPGRVAQGLAEAEGLSVRAVGARAATGTYVHDRRSGERKVVAEVPGTPLTRHEVDELYGAALVEALDAGICVLTGPVRPWIISPKVYGRLAGDLRRHGVKVVADLSGANLASALAGGIDLLKVSDEDLARDGMGDVRTRDDAVATARRLCAEGAGSAIVSRAEEPLIASLDGELVEVCPPQLQPVDPRGSGDSLTAVLAAGVFWGLPPVEALRWGAAAGCLTVARHGLATADRREIHRLAAHVAVRPL